MKSLPLLIVRRIQPEKILLIARENRAVRPQDLTEGNAGEFVERFARFPIHARFFPGFVRDEDIRFPVRHDSDWRVRRLFRRWAEFAMEPVQFFVHLDPPDRIKRPFAAVNRRLRRRERRTEVLPAVRLHVDRDKTFDRREVAVIDHDAEDPFPHIPDRIRADGMAELTITAIKPQLNDPVRILAQRQNQRSQQRDRILFDDNCLRQQLGRVPVRNLPLKAGIPGKKKLINRGRAETVRSQDASIKQRAQDRQSFAMPVIHRCICVFHPAGRNFRQRAGFVRVRIDADAPSKQPDHLVNA